MRDVIHLSMKFNPPINKFPQAILQGNLLYLYSTISCSRLFPKFSLYVNNSRFKLKLFCFSTIFHLKSSKIFSRFYPRRCKKYPTINYVEFVCTYKHVMAMAPILAVAFFSSQLMHWSGKFIYL